MRFSSSLADCVRAEDWLKTRKRQARTVQNSQIHSYALANTLHSVRVPLKGGPYKRNLRSQTAFDIRRRALGRGHRSRQ